MSSTYLALHYHIVFCTKGREPSIDKVWRHELHEYLGGTIRGLGGLPRAIGGVADHVHLLLDLKATHCLSDFMRELKKSASAWGRTRSGMRGFSWQEGYSAFTVSASALDSVRVYIANQEEHHRGKSFAEELAAFLNKAGIAYDPRQGP